MALLMSSFKAADMVADGMGRMSRMMFQCLAPSKSLQCQAWPAAVFEKDWSFRRLRTAALIFDELELDDEQSTTCLYWRLSTANYTHTILAWSSSTLDFIVLDIFLGRCFCLCLCHEEFWQATRSTATGKYSEATAATAGTRTHPFIIDK